MATATAPDPTNPLGVRVSPYWRVPPQAAQYVFLSLPHMEALYGGAAGGGKSFALLMAALQYVDVPGYDALLLRRAFPQLNASGGLMDVARKWLRGTDAKWNDTDHRFTFPSGATLNFGYLANERDLDNFQGPSYAFIGVDELTQFPERHYRFIFSRLRKAADSPVPIRMRTASNPGNRGHRWVKQRFLVEGVEKNRMFVPARLADNPGLNQELYLRSLAELDPTTRRQQLDGDWDAKPAGAMFDRDWFEVVDELPHPLELRFLRYWDQAASQPTEAHPDPDWTVGLKLAHHWTADEWIVVDVVRARERPGGVERLVKGTARADGAEIPIVFEEEPGASGKHMIHEWQQKLAAYAVRGRRADTHKVARAAPVAARAERGKVKLLVGPWVSDFLDEIEDFPEVDHDDQVDALSGAYAELASSPQMPESDPFRPPADSLTADLLDRKM